MQWHTHVVKGLKRHAQNQNDREQPDRKFGDNNSNDTEKPKHDGEKSMDIATVRYCRPDKVLQILFKGIRPIPKVMIHEQQNGRCSVLAVKLNGHRVAFPSRYVRREAPKTQAPVAARWQGP